MRLLKVPLRIVGLMLFFACLVSCSVRKKEVIGTYYIKYPPGSQTLELKPDGRYKQVLNITETGETIIKEGIWGISSEDGTIYLESGLEIVTHTGDLNPNYANPVKDNVFFSLSRTHWLWGEVILTNPHYQMHRIN